MAKYITSPTIEAVFLNMFSGPMASLVLFCMTLICIVWMIGASYALPKLSVSSSVSCLFLTIPSGSL